MASQRQAPTRAASLAPQPQIPSPAILNIQTSKWEEASELTEELGSLTHCRERSSTQLGVHSDMCVPDPCPKDVDHPSVFRGDRAKELAGREAFCAGVTGGWVGLTRRSGSAELIVSGGQGECPAQDGVSR